MDWVFYFVGWAFVNIATDVGIPKEHRVNIFSRAGILQQILIISGILLIHYSNILK